MKGKMDKKILPQHGDSFDIWSWYNEIYEAIYGEDCNSEPKKRDEDEE